jgi:hypothetical protein
VDERCAVDLDCTDDVIISDLLGAVDDHLRANAGRLNRMCELLQAPFQSVCSGARIMHTEQFVFIQVCSMHSLPSQSASPTTHCSIGADNHQLAAKSSRQHQGCACLFSSATGHGTDRCCVTLFCRSDAAIQCCRVDTLRRHYPHAAWFLWLMGMPHAS